MSVYNENRDQNMSLEDEIKEQRSKMKGQPFRVQFAYFKEYYLKMTIVISIIMIAVIALILSIVNKPEDTVFGCYFINNSGEISDTSLLDGFVTQLGVDPKKHEVFLDTTMHYQPDDQDPYAYVSIEKIMAMIAAGSLDVIVGDDTVANYYAYGKCYLDITTVLPADLLEKFSDSLYYYTDENGTTMPIGIYLDDCPKLKTYHYYDHTRPVFGIIANSSNIDNAITFLRYLYAE